jgi:hypothetical protein
MTDDERRPTDWPDDRLADAFLARAAARPTPADLTEATLERVRESSPPSTSRFDLRSIGALAAAAAIVVAVGAIAIGQRPVDPANQPTMALGLPVVSVSEAIAIHDTDPTDREIAVRGYFSPALPLPCPAPDVRTSENPIRLDCPLMTQWLLENPERLVTRSSNSMEGRAPDGPAFHPVFPFIDMSAVTAAGRKDDPVELVVIGHFHDRRGDPDTALCGATPDANCDSFVIDGIHSVAGTRVASSTVIDLEPWPPEPRREPTWTSDDVDRLVQNAVPSFAILSRVALPGHRIRELEPSLGTGALNIIDRPIAWVVTGLDASAGGSPPMRRTFLIVDGTAEAYETAPWNVEPNVGFVPFALIPLPFASPEPTDAAAEPITLDVVDVLDRHLSVEIVDESGLLVSAAPVAPGTPSDVPTPGNDVAVSQVAGHANEIRLSWVGGACDGPVRFTIRSDGRTILVEQGPWEGDTGSFCILVGIPRSITLDFSEPVPAAEVEIVGGAGTQIVPADEPSNPPSTVVGEPISVRAAIEHRDNDLDDTEIAVKGWLVALPIECLGTPEPPVSPAEQHCGDGLVWLAEEPPTQEGPGLAGPEPPAFNVLVRPETYKQVVVVQPGQPVEVIVLGHFDDHRAAQCPPDHVETCRRNFVVDAVLDATRPGIDGNAIEALRPDPSIRTAAPAEWAARVATGAQRGAGRVLASFPVSGSAVAGFEPQATASNELTSATAVWIVRYVDVGIDERPVLKTKLIIDGPIDSLHGSIFIPSPAGLLRETVSE